MANPKVSVILCAFNEERYIEDAVRSILSQTFEDFELIIIDDYSTDRTLEICRSFADPRLRIHSKTNESRSLAASRNIGIAMARGEYIILQDGDDRSEPTRIAKQLAKSEENPGRLVVGCWVRQAYGQKEWLLRTPETHAEIVKGFRRLSNRATIVSGTIMAPAQIMREIPYRVRFEYSQDWDHMLRLYESRRVELCNYPEPLYNYLIRDKATYLKPHYFDDNIFCRNSQQRRRRGQEEFSTRQDFFAYLDAHPLEKAKWMGLRLLLRLNRWRVVRRKWR
jgi:glycosyltransferase involved in cell wall biosynthesis